MKKYSLMFYDKIGSKTTYGWTTDFVLIIRWLIESLSKDDISHIDLKIEEDK